MNEIEIEETKETFSGKQKLTIRDRKFIKALTEGKSQTQSMRIAGYSDKTARFKSGQKLAKLAPTIQALMESQSLTDERLVNVLKAGLNAKKPVQTRHGIIDYPDYLTQHKFLETGLKLRGYLRDKVDVKVNLDLAERIREARIRARIEAGSHSEDR
jgi:phage terminase small subunit